MTTDKSSARKVSFSVEFESKCVAFDFRLKCINFRHFIAQPQTTRGIDLADQGQAQQYVQCDFAIYPSHLSAHTAMRVFAALVPCLCMVLSINALSRSSIVIIRGGKDVPKTRETKAEQVGLLVTLKKVIQQLRRLFFPSWNNIQPSSKTAQKKADATDSSQNRIQKELRNFMASPPHNCEVSVGKNIRVWVVTLTGVEGTVYEGEKYKLKFVFPKEYPSRPPGVYFLKPTPKHQHGEHS